MFVQSDRVGVTCEVVRPAVMRRMLTVAAAGLFALASMMLLPGTASSQTVDQITLTAVQVTTGARDIEAAPGDTVTMIIRASGAQAMQGLQFTLVYNPAVVEVVGVPLAESQPGALFVVELDIANVTFRVVGEPGASTSLSFTAIAVGDGSAPSQAIPATSISGSITVVSQAQQAEATPTAVPASTPVPVPTDVPNTPTPTPTPAPAPSSPAVTPEAQQAPAATAQPVPLGSSEPTPTSIAVPVAAGPTAVPTTQALAAGSTQAQPESSPTAAIGTEAQKPQETATPAPLAAQVAGAPQPPASASTPGPGATAPAPSAAQVQAQTSQAGSEPAAAAPPPAEPQGGMGCTAPLLGSSPSKSGLGDLMLLGTVVGSLLISSRFRRRR